MFFFFRMKRQYFLNALILSIFPITLSNEVEYKAEDIEAKAREYMKRLNELTAKMQNKVSLAAFAHQTDLLNHNHRKVRNRPKLNIKFNGSWKNIFKYFICIIKRYKKWHKLISIDSVPHILQNESGKNEIEHTLLNVNKWLEIQNYNNYNACHNYHFISST